METFHTIVTHENPHLDEIAAIWLLRKFGEKEFPEISSAKIEFWATGGKTPDGRLVKEYEKKGILLIGVGGGRFDEHPPINGERKQDECAATLVAKNLGINNDLAFEKILKFAINSDLKSGGHPFDIAALTKLLHQQYPNNPEKVIEWVIMALEAKYHEQLEFFAITKADFEKNSEIEEIPGPNGRTLKMATIVSENPLMNKFARSDHGGNADIVIQIQPSGNIQIFTNAQSNLVFYDVAQMIRITEQQAKGRLLTTDWKLLASGGKVEGAEEWYFQVAGQMLLNGSLTATQVPPTKIPLEKIKEIVCIGVNPMEFHPKRASRCKQGICSSTLNNPCPWYIYGFHRCRQTRFQTRTS